MFEISELKAKTLVELQQIAKTNGLKKISQLKKLELIYQILDIQATHPIKTQPSKTEPLKAEQPKAEQPKVERPKRKRVTRKVTPERKEVESKVQYQNLR